MSEAPVIAAAGHREWRAGVTTGQMVFALPH
ncbi:protein of unknown function [Hyphomicrobium sp. 1Nfss2.1]